MSTSSESRELARKRLVWIADSRSIVRGFPKDARRRAGLELLRVQDRLLPLNWKPMPAIGIGVNEIRVRIAGERRILYVAKFSEAVYVLAAFEKKTQRTAKREIDAAMLRYRALLKHRANA
jgi:phage-related protein